LIRVHEIREEVKTDKRANATTVEPKLDAGNFVRIVKSYEVASMQMNTTDTFVLVFIGEFHNIGTGKNASTKSVDVLVDAWRYAMAFVASLGAHWCAAILSREWFPGLPQRKINQILSPRFTRVERNMVTYTTYRCHGAAKMRRKNAPRLNLRKSMEIPYMVPLALKILCALLTIFGYRNAM
jgi:hypothetical protein